MYEKTTLETALIGIDWGTSRLRGFRIGPEGRVLERRESDRGIAAIRDGDFDPALHTLIADWQPEPGALPIFMCGMIGSRQGWREAPYRPCPARLADLVDTLLLVETSCGPAVIVGGLSTTDDAGCRDVMRGEETRILGTTAPASERRRVVAPGTHSKWAIVDDGRIENFRTYMTGEVYGLLCEHSSLGWLTRDVGSATPDEKNFVAGVRRALDDPRLLHLIFDVRARGLFERESPAVLASYLSGLLIGSEITGELRHAAADPIDIIASPTLGRSYGIALAAAGCADVRHVDASDAAALGLWRLWQLRRT